MLGLRVVVTARYADSTVGPYLELAVGQPARLGTRVGLCVTTMAVNSPGSCRGGMENWGFPKEMATLGWSDAGGRRSLSWQERGWTVTGSGRGPSVPLLAPLLSLQRRADGPVLVPARLWGTARAARVRLSIPPGDPLAPLDGDHAGVVVSGLRLRVAPARNLG